MLTAKFFRFYLGLIFILSSQMVFAANGQTDNFANTMKLQSGMVSPKASIADVAWITGYWQGEMWGGTNRRNLVCTFGRQHDGIV